MVAEDICYALKMKNEDGEDLLMKWGVVSSNLEWVIGIDEEINRHNYKMVATDLDIIMSELQNDENLEGLNFRIVNSSEIHFNPTTSQQLMFRIRYCGQELLEE